MINGEFDHFKCTSCEKVDFDLRHPKSTSLSAGTLHDNNTEIFIINRRGRRGRSR